MAKLQTRDIEILKLCYEQQWVLHSHVQSFFHGSCAEREARRRIQELGGLRLLRRELTPILKQPAYRVTKAGSTVAELNGSPYLKPQARISLVNSVHDAKVTSVRLRISKLWNANFTPERALKENDLYEIPDGVFTFASGVNVALELENSVKSRSRLVKLCGRWENIQSINLVLYVAATAAIEKTVKAAVTAAQSTKPIGVIQYDKLFADAPAVWTVKGDSFWFSRRDL